MDIKSIVLRHRLLLEELKRRISARAKWGGVPGLLDELHSLRCAYDVALAEVADQGAARVQLAVAGAGTRP